MKLNQEQIERMDGLVGKDSMESAESAIIDAMYELDCEGFDDQMIEAYLIQRLANDVRKAIKTKNSIREEINK